MRTHAAVLAGALALAGCKQTETPPAEHATAPVAAPAAASADEAELAGLRAKEKEVGENGAEAGRVREREGELLEQAGRLAAAADAFEAAAGAYGRSPEATNMPVINAERCRKRAEALRARLKK